MSKQVYIVLILLLLVLGMLWYVKKDSNRQQTTAQSAKKKYIDVTYLDIGQGDATFIEWPDRTQMLVDCAKDARVLEALGRVMPFYDKHIDYLLVTHPDLDHYGGCIDVLKRFDIEHIVYTGVQKEDDTWAFFWKKIQEEGSEYTEIDKEQQWSIGSSTLAFLYPDHDASEDANILGLKKKAGSNNSSIVFTLSHGEMDLLFMGDAEAELEEYLLQKHKEKLDVDVLKVSHHGSAGSSIPKFVSSTSPDISVISAGKENRYGHPSRRVIKRLERASSTIWRTDLHGDVRMQVYKDRILVDT